MPLDYPTPDGRLIVISRIRASGTPAEYRGALPVNPVPGLDYAAKRAKMLEAVQRSTTSSASIRAVPARAIRSTADSGAGCSQRPASGPAPTI